MFVDFDERPRPVGGLTHAIALRPVFHRSSMVTEGALPARFPAAAAATAAAAVTAEAAAAAEPAFGLGPRFVDGQRASAHLKLIELARRFLRFFVGRHLDEREAARAAGGGVPHDAHRFDRAGLAEQLLQFRLTGGVRKVPDVQPATHHSLLEKPITEPGGCGASAARSLGGSESDSTLDRLSARAKQAGGRPPRAGSLPTAPDQTQVKLPL